jgi:hypothetical protein
MSNHKRKANPARRAPKMLDATLTEVEAPAFLVTDAPGADEDEDDPEEADLVPVLEELDVTEVMIPDVVDAGLVDTWLADASEDDEVMPVVDCDCAAVI